MAGYTEVFVTPAKGGAALLENGTGQGDMGTFACGKFPTGIRPVKNEKYNIQALADGDPFPMDWGAVCDFSGETSQFKG